MEQLQGFTLDDIITTACLSAVHKHKTGLDFQIKTKF